MVVLAYHRTYKLHRVLAMRLRVIFQIDPWSLYQLGFRSDHFLLVECQLQESSGVEVIYTRHNYCVLSWIAISEFFTYLFLFFLQQYKVFGLIFVCLIFFLSLSQLFNFLKSAPLQLLATYLLRFPRRAPHYPWVSSGPFGFLLLFRCFYLNFLVRMVVSGVTARKLNLKSYHALSLSHPNYTTFGSLWRVQTISNLYDCKVANNTQIIKNSLPCNPLSHDY